VDNVRLEGVEAEIEDQIQAMLRNWDSPLGRAFQDATDIVEEAARIAAPVSPKGSKLAPIGFLKATTRQSLERHKDDEGIIMGLVGASRYPYNFIANPTSHKGYTWNRGRKSYRKADNDYLKDSLNSLNGFVRYVGLLCRP
jgi:hypothetical protein